MLSIFYKSIKTCFNKRYIKTEGWNGLCIWYKNIGNNLEEPQDMAIFNTHIWLEYMKDSRGQIEMSKYSEFYCFLNPCSQ